MKKFYSLALMTACLFAVASLNAQTTVTWALAADDAPNVTSGTGFTTTNQTRSSGLDYANYAGYDNDGNLGAQRVKNSTLNPCLPLNFASDYYLEYSITATSDYNLTITNVDMYLAAGGTTSIYAKIECSTDNFATSTTLDDGSVAVARNASSSSITAGTLSAKNFTPSTAVPAGSTFKVRVSPKYTGAASTSKYLISSQVKITLTATASGPSGITETTQATLDPNGKTSVYGIDGKLIRSNVTRSSATNGLAKGLYIVDKQKVIVSK